MNKKRSFSCLVLLLLIIIGVSSCRGYPYETNPLETMVPLEYSEEAINDGSYFQAIKGLYGWGYNPPDIKYPTLDHLLFLYISDYWGSGNPPHSLLFDFRARKAIYCAHKDIVHDNISGAYTFVDLSTSDIDTILNFESVCGITSWDNYYGTTEGEAHWNLTLYFDDGSFFQSGGGVRPDEYETLEDDIWPLIGNITGDEFWWM